MPYMRLPPFPVNTWPAGSVSVGQMKQALVDAGGSAIYSVGNVIPADIADPANIIWTGGGWVSPCDSLATLIKSTLSYSDGQMTALATDARVCICRGELNRTSLAS